MTLFLLVWAPHNVQVAVRSMGLEVADVGEWQLWPTLVSAIATFALSRLVSTNPGHASCEAYWLGRGSSRFLVNGELRSARFWATATYISLYTECNRGKNM